MRGKPSENFPRGNVHTPTNPRASTTLTDLVVLRTNLAHSVIGQVSKGSSMTPSFHRLDMAKHSENSFSLLPHEPDLDCMQESHAHSCTRITQAQTIPHDRLHREHITLTFQPETLHTFPSQHNGPLLQPKLLHPNSDRPRSPPHLHSPPFPKFPKHSLRDHSFSQIPRPSPVDGTSRTNLEWSLLRLLQR